jgi:hypothetical protein
MAYNVYLMNGLEISNALSRPKVEQQQKLLLEVLRILQGYFDRVVKAHDRLRIQGATQYGNAIVNGLASFPTVAPHELLIYLLPMGATVATHGKLEAGTPPPNHDGRTNPNLSGGTASEVYLHDWTPAVIANLVFHEAMHNKLRLDNSGLHSRGDMAASSVGPETILSARNTNDMAAALDRHSPQWVDGIKLLVNEAMKPDSDPSKGLF